MREIEHIEALGHSKIRALHKSTIEFTKHDWLTPRGDCIIAVSANKGAHDLSHSFRKLACNDQAVITANVSVGDLLETVKGFGSKMMTLDHHTDLVIRKSSYVCGRTLMINADRAARNLPHNLVNSLKNPAMKIKIEIIVEI